MKNALSRSAILLGLSFAGFGQLSAATIDLIGGNSGTSNGALYQWVSQQSTGTGVIEPFLRVQANTSEQGYNHSNGATNTPWDTKSGVWTHDIKLNQIPTKTISGTAYLEFLLDINQNSGQSNEFLSLNEVQIFTRTGAIATSPDSTAGLGTLRFDMDVGAQGDTAVYLNYARNAGSGSGDMFLYVPLSLFAAANGNDQLYFYTQFGLSGTGTGADGALGIYASNDGFEEWAVVGQSTGVPDGGSTVALLGLGLATLALIRRRS